MKFIKISLHNKINNEFLVNFMIFYIEREIIDDIDSCFLIDKFYLLKNHKLLLKYYFIVFSLLFLFLFLYF